MNVALDLFLSFALMACTGWALYLASMTLVDAWRRREKRRAAEVVVGAVAGVVREQLRHSRQLVLSSSRRGGKLEAQRAVVEVFVAGGGVAFVPSKVPSFVEQQPRFWRRYPGEFIIGERLTWESRILDGDYPRFEEPAGIFNSKPGEPSTLSTTPAPNWPTLERLHAEVMSRRRE